MYHNSVFRHYFPDEPSHFADFLRSVRGHVQPSRVMLDLGCGSDVTFSRLRAAGRTVWGADFQQHPHIVSPEWFRLLPADGGIPFPDASFDVVATAWVLEHVDQPIPFLNEVRRVLRPGGLFIGHSVNARHYMTWIRQALDVLPLRTTQWLVERLYGRAAHDTFPTRYRMNTLKQLEKLGQTTGMDVVGWRQFVDPGYFAFHRLALDMAVRADWLLDRLFPGRGRIYFTVTFQRPFAKTNRVTKAAA